MFEFECYKEYVHARLSVLPGQGRGERSRLAASVGCHGTYVSQVLNGNAEFTLEQAEKVNRHFGHTPEESHYFLLLVQFGRAGTPTLKRYFRSQMNEIQKRELDLKNRLKATKSLSNEEQNAYYRSWYVAAIHVLLSIPKFRTREAIAQELGLSLETVTKTLNYLLRAGLAKLEEGKFSIGERSLHLARGAEMGIRHHINWRMRAIASLEEEASEDLHYSSVISLSENDLSKVKAIMVKAIEDVRALVRDSKEEVLYCYTLDLFPVRKI